MQSPLIKDFPLLCQQPSRQACFHKLHPQLGNPQNGSNHNTNHSFIVQHNFSTFQKMAPSYSSCFIYLAAFRAYSVAIFLFYIYMSTKTEFQLPISFHSQSSWYSVQYMFIFTKYICIEFSFKLVRIFAVEMHTVEQ